MELVGTYTGLSFAVLDIVCSFSVNQSNVDCSPTSQQGRQTSGTSVWLLDRLKQG